MKKKAAKNHIMIDIETLGLSINSVITSIGATRFTMCPDEFSITDKFVRNIPVAHQIDDMRRDVDPDTLAWWVRTDVRQLVRMMSHVDDSVTLGSAVMDLHAFIGETKNLVSVWSNGTDFDIAMLNNICRQRIPNISSGLCNYAIVKDYRTIRNLFGALAENRIASAPSHIGIEDAEYQSKELHAIMSGIIGSMGKDRKFV